MPPATDTQTEVPIAAVENPILCNPYDEPNKHWFYDRKSGSQTCREGRRDASYFWQTEKTGTRQQSMLAPDAEDLPLVNWLRDDVRRWRASNYRGATQTTKALLGHWTRSERARRLFFCQREAIETQIFLAEIIFGAKVATTADGKFSCGFKPNSVYERFERYPWTLPAGHEEWPLDDERRFYATPLDALLDGAESGKALRRQCSKMATGSGKTVVMAMLTAWALCNRGVEPGSTQFPNNVLIIGPNLTVGSRLRVLLPEEPDNYYAKFDIVPSKFRTLLRPGHVRVLNWHKLAPEGAHVEGGKSYTVVNKGEEGDEAFARRVLADGFDHGELLVLNDEAHHAWRPAVPRDEVTGEAKDELDEATIWVDGLDRLNRGIGIRFVADLSATPFYIQGSGQPNGTPFAWLVSEFGLVDAIECGIVKIPRLPVSDTTGRPEPKYFRLWQNIVFSLQPGDKQPGKAGKPKADAVWREGQDALNTLSAQWKARFDQVRDAGKERIPPVMILVCDNTDIAKVFFEHISGEHQEEYVEDDDAKGKKKTRTVYGKSDVFDEFANTPTRRHTLRIDSKQLAVAESDDPEATRDEAAQLLRRIVDTVGKPGEPGEFIRCVVSVAMLTEGWDANNVTHILGLRAFGSQLLCEQVVGRGLRRMDYDPDPETGLLRAEYVDVYGIPFSVIPFKGRSTTKPEPEDKPQTWVRAREERREYEIEFPVVEGYVFALEKGLIRCDVDKVQPLKLTPETMPTGVFVKPQVGYQLGAPSAHGPGETELQNREVFWASTHLQTIQFEVARRVVDALASVTTGGKLRHASRHQLFPQVYRIVERFVETRIDWNGVPDKRELGLDRYVGLLVERLVAAIEPDVGGGEPPILPILNRHHSRASTASANFKTTRLCFDTIKSHIDHVVADTQTWEQSAAFYLEASEVVAFYARNDRVDFEIMYEFLTVSHVYIPDFLVRLKDGRTLILEIKGVEDEQDRAKHEATRRWVQAVNNWNQMGKWAFHVCRNPQTLGKELEGLAAAEVVKGKVS